MPCNDGNNRIENKKKLNCIKIVQITKLLYKYA